MAKQTFIRPAALAKIERILQLLTERPRTAHELAEAIPMSKRHAQEYVNHLHSAQRIYISTWRRHVEHSGRMYPRPAYRVQPADCIRRDASKPKPLTPDERKRRAWELVKADPERHMTHILKKRKYRADRKGPRTDIAANWIFQEAA